ncbi:MAG: hypothetical protein V2B18_05585 [Pseudomonadota bacterium]
MEDTPRSVKRSKWRSLEEEKAALDDNPIAQSILSDLESQGRNRSGMMIDMLEREERDNESEEDPREGPQND